MRLAFNRDTVEVFLTLAAAIAGSIAATGAFVGAGYEKDRVELERRPAIYLSCQAEFPLLDAVHKIPQPAQSLLLTEHGVQWVHNSGVAPFARCAVTNFGRLAALDVRIPLRVWFAPSASASEGSSDDAHVEVPGLSPDASFQFGLVNGGPAQLTYRFGRTIELSRVDLDEPTPERLFTDALVAELEQRPADPASPVPSGRGGQRRSATRVDIKDFRYLPAELRVAAGTSITFVNLDGEPHTVTATQGTFFDSGVLDPNGIWRHRFRTPGRYVYSCTFHPYMRGTIVVTARSP